jgi:hypothetical protein
MCSPCAWIQAQNKNETVLEKSHPVQAASVEEMAQEKNMHCAMHCYLAELVP